MEEEKLKPVEAFAKESCSTLMKLQEPDVCMNKKKYTRLFSSSLRLESQLNHVECVRELIKWGVDVNYSDQFEVTAVHLAAENGYVDVLRELLSAGAAYDTPIKCSDTYSRTSVSYVNGTTPLHLAAKGNHIDCVRELIQYGADYNAIDEKGRTSLYIAAENKFADCVLVQLQNAIGKVILSLPEFESGNTPLHFAVQNGMVECVEALLEAGSDPQHVNNIGFSPLRLALSPSIKQMEEEKSNKIVQHLVLRGHDIDLNTADRFGLTPLHYVAINSRFRLNRFPKLAHFLIAYGADPCIKNYRGQSLLEIELLSPFEDLTILKAITQSMLHPPLLTFRPMGEFCAPASIYKPPVIMFNTSVRENRKIKWYIDAVRRPMSLQHYCRYSIRKIMGPKRLRHIKCLSIPTKIKSFLILHTDTVNNFQ